MTRHDGTPIIDHTRDARGFRKHAVRPAALPELDDAHRQLTTTREITIAGLPGYKCLQLPAGTRVELLGYSNRTGLPRIRCVAYALDEAIVSPEAVGLDDASTRAHDDASASG